MMMTIGVQSLMRMRDFFEDTSSNDQEVESKTYSDEPEYDDNELDDDLKGLDLEDDDEFDDEDDDNS